MNCLRFSDQRYSNITCQTVRGSYHCVMYKDLYLAYYIVLYSALRTCLLLLIHSYFCFFVCFISDSMPCSNCPSGSWWDSKIQTCTPKTLDFLEWNHPFTYICYAITAIGICNASIIAIIFIIYRGTPIIKAINRPLTSLQLCANFGLLCLFLVYIGEPNQMQCQLQLILRGPIFSLAVCSFVVKTRQVLRIFSSRLSTLVRRRGNSNGHNLQITFVLTGTLLHLFILIAYFIFRPSSVLVLNDMHTTTTYLECDFGVYVVIPNNGYLFSLCAISFFLSYRARHVPENFGEARHISHSVGISLFFWAACLPSFAVSHGRQKAIFPILILYTTAFSIQLLYFFPKCHLVLFQPHRNTKEEIRRLTMDHMKKQVARRVNSSSFTPPSTTNGNEERNLTFTRSTVLYSYEAQRIPSISNSIQEYSLSPDLEITNVRRKRKYQVQNGSCVDQFCDNHNGDIGMIASDSDETNILDKSSENSRELSSFPDVSFMTEVELETKSYPKWRQGTWPSTQRRRVSLTDLYEQQISVERYLGGESRTEVSSFI